MNRNICPSRSGRRALTVALLLVLLPTRAGGRTVAWLLSSFGWDGDPEYALFERWHRHYRSLGLLPKYFIILVHVRPLGSAGALCSEREDACGVRAMKHLGRFGVGRVAWYSTHFASNAHHERLMEMQRRYVRPHDWVVFAESDEFLALPPCLPGLSAKPARCWSSLSIPRFIGYLQSIGARFADGIMVDRLSRDGTPLALAKNRSVHELFPRICDITMRVQRADVRKVVFYRGDLATFDAHTVFTLEGSRPSHFPPASTVYHFKWTSGVRDRLEHSVYGHNAVRMLHDHQMRMPAAELCARNWDMGVGLRSPTEGLLPFALVMYLARLTRAELMTYVRKFIWAYPASTNASLALRANMMAQWVLSQVLVQWSGVSRRTGLPRSLSYLELQPPMPRRTASGEWIGGLHS